MTEHEGCIYYDKFEPNEMPLELQDPLQHVYGWWDTDGDEEGAET